MVRGQGLGNSHVQPGSRYLAGEQGLIQVLLVHHATPERHRETRVRDPTATTPTKVSPIPSGGFHRTWRAAHLLVLMKMEVSFILEKRLLLQISLVSGVKAQHTARKSERSASWSKETGPRETPRRVSCYSQCLNLCASSEVFQSGG